MSEIYMYMCCKVLLDHIWPSSSNTLWNKQIINNQTGWRSGLDINAVYFVLQYCQYSTLLGVLGLLLALIMWSLYMSS